MRLGGAYSRVADEHVPRRVVRAEGASSPRTWRSSILPVRPPAEPTTAPKGELPQAWRRAIDAAQRTPEGRARIALAFAIGQWPAWAGHRSRRSRGSTTSRRSSTACITRSSTTPRTRAEKPASGRSWRRPVSSCRGTPAWTIASTSPTATSRSRSAVRQLYQEAGLDLDADIARVNAFPRVTASPYALEWWNRPGRTAKGTPRIPLLRLHEVGDQQVPISLVQGYGDLIRANGKDDLYRFAAVNSPAHCNYTAAETMAAVETMMRRLDTGHGEARSPEQMNALAASLSRAPHGSRASAPVAQSEVQPDVVPRVSRLARVCAHIRSSGCCVGSGRRVSVPEPPARSAATAAPGNFSEQGGKLPDGTEYPMRVPPSWNGTVIRDLDYASNAGSRTAWRNYSYLLAKGYALIGTGRHPLRALGYDPAVEIANLDRVLDMFDRRFRRPDRVIQLGCSGGGAVTLGVAEDFSSRIDGAVAMAAHIPVWQMNTFLDGWFTLKALIAPDLPVVDLPFEASGEIRPDVVDAWRQAINAAQQTPEGRARIALAFTLGQWPAWVNGLAPQPRLENAAELQHSMYHAVFQKLPTPAATAGSGRSWLPLGGSCRGTRGSTTGSSSRTATTPSGTLFGSCIRKPACQSRLTLNGSTRFLASRLLRMRSSGGMHQDERRRVLPGFPSFGYTRSATRAFLPAWCRATTIWSVRTAGMISIGPRKSTRRAIAGSVRQRPWRRLKP